MKKYEALFVGGPVDGRILTVSPEAETIRIPVAKEDRAKWYRYDQPIKMNTFMFIEYRRETFYVDGEEIYLFVMEKYSLAKALNTILLSYSEHQTRRYE